MSDFKKLHVWRKAHALALNVHRVSGKMRGAEYASDRSQIRRAAKSIPTNIIEGRGQKSTREQRRFLGYAINSSSELEYHLIVAKDTQAISKSDFLTLLNDVIEVRKMLYGLLGRLSEKPAKARR